MLKKDIINEIKNKKLPVVIYGAGIVGKVLLSLCKEEGIAVDCFCDSSEKVAQEKFCDKEVIFAPDLKKKYKEAIFLISVVAIKDVVDFLRELGFSNWYAGGLLLKDSDIFQNQPDASIDYTKYAIETCILCHDGYLNPDKLFLRSIDIIITERCSLKCRGCSNLMQYYEKPQNCDTDTLFKSIDAFCAVFDEVMDFRIIGGEPFMNIEWPIIVKKLTDNSKTKRVVIYTNGTIIPNEKHISYLKNEKVVVVISDYGALSRNLAGLKQMLEKNKISHYVMEINEWLDCSAITPHNRSVEGNMEIFKKCCAKNMATLSDGKFFRCPYAANAVRLSAVPDNKNDYVDLFQEPLDEKGILATKNKIREYLSNNNYLQICDFCSGRPLSGSAIPPNIQTEKALPYHKYN
jgi:sulfatase maturation enzyme AslB (radical SAM superfamily)